MRLRMLSLPLAAVVALLLFGGVVKAQTAPQPQCVSGSIQLDANRTVVYTPDCQNPKNRLGTTALAAWIRSNFSNIGHCPVATDPDESPPACGIYVAIYTFNDPDIKQVLLDAEAAGIPVHVALDYSELQAVGAGADKKESLGEKVSNESEHMLVNDLCAAHVDVVWGTSPADDSHIMHDKLTMLVNAKGVVFAYSYGSLNYSTQADFEANFIFFDADPVGAAHAFNNWMIIHDSMVARGKLFYSPVSDEKKAKMTADEVAALDKRPQVCPAIAGMPTYGTVANGPAPKGKERAPRRKKP